MWPIGSAPVVEGAPAVRRTHTARGTGAYPAKGPAMTRFAYGAPRLSIQRTHSPTGLPCASTGTVLDHCPVQLTASTCPGRTAPEAIARCAASRTRSHHSAASCTAPPPGRRWVSTGQWSLHATLPVSDTRPTLGPPVPRSIARTKRSARSAGVAGKGSLNSSGGR